MQMSEAQTVTSAIELAPTVISGLTTIANDVNSDTAAHKSVIATAADAASAAVTSLQAVAASGAVGQNDAANISTGIAVAEEAAGLGAELAALIAKIRAWL
jgi:hypothetical protein